MNYNEMYKLAEESYLKNKLQNSNAIEKANYIAGFIEAVKLRNNGK